MPTSIMRSLQEPAYRRQGQSGHYRAQRHQVVTIARVFVTPRSNLLARIPR